MKIGIVQYGAGNQASVINALERFGVSSFAVLTPDDLSKADKLIIPGVGHAGKAMRVLRQNGLDIALQKTNLPLLGICLGMQLLGQSSTEGNTPCLGLCDYSTQRFNIKFKIPHMGWNRAKLTENPLFYKIGNNEWFYFVHSYYVPKSNQSIATCRYEVDFVAAVQHGKFWGVQFHPEKSGEFGLQIIKNFIELCR